ncbi:MAG: hypothetical protein ACXWMI_01060 [Syntrophales bacterium]
MLRPVDLQQILTQSNSMERVQQTQQQHPDMQQRYFSVQLSEERKHLKEAVKNSEETEKSKIRGEEEKEKRQKKTKSDAESAGKMEMKQEPENPDDVEQGGLIDIKV